MRCQNSNYWEIFLQLLTWLHGSEDFSIWKYFQQQEFMSRFFKKYFMIWEPSQLCFLQFYWYTAQHLAFYQILAMMLIVAQQWAGHFICFYRMSSDLCLEILIVMFMIQTTKLFCTLLLAFRCAWLCWTWL